MGTETESNSNTKTGLISRVTGKYPNFIKLMIWVLFFIVVVSILSVLISAGILTNQRPGWLNDVYLLIRIGIYAALIFRFRNNVRKMDRFGKLIIGSCVVYEIAIVQEFFGLLEGVW